MFGFSLSFILRQGINNFTKTNSTKMSNKTNVKESYPYEHITLIGVRNEIDEINLNFMSLILYF